MTCRWGFNNRLPGQKVWSRSFVTSETTCSTSDFFLKNYRGTNSSRRPRRCRPILIAVEVGMRLPCCYHRGRAVCWFRFGKPGSLYGVSRWRIGWYHRFDTLPIHSVTMSETALGWYGVIYTIGTVWNAAMLLCVAIFIEGKNELVIAWMFECLILSFYLRSEVRCICTTLIHGLPLTILTYCWPWFSAYLKLRKAKDESKLARDCARTALSHVKRHG